MNLNILIEYRDMLIEIRKEKNEFVRKQDYSKAADLRDKENALLREVLEKYMPDKSNVNVFKYLENEIERLERILAKRKNIIKILNE